MSDKYNRRSIRLKNYDYSQMGYYFLTIVVQNHASVFGEIIDGTMTVNEYGRIVETEWYKINQPDGKIKCDSFVVMPNHIHGILQITNNVGAIRELPSNAKTPNNPDNANNPGDIRAIRELPLRNQRRMMLLSKIIGKFKMVTSKKINQLRNTTGNKLWQRNYYEHIIRDERSYENILNYIKQNPMKWGEDRFYR